MGNYSLDTVKFLYDEVYEKLPEGHANKNNSGEWLKKAAIRSLKANPATWALGMALDHSEKSVKLVKWMVEALQGDWNDNRTVGQIAADAVLSMVPFIDQILDIRDLSANAHKLFQDNLSSAEKKEAWLGLCLSLIGLVPTVGSLLKGVLKIILVSIKRYGRTAIKASVKWAMDPIRKFLMDEKIAKIFNIKDFAVALKGVKDELKIFNKSLNAKEMAAKYKIALKNLKSTIDYVKKSKIIPRGAIAGLEQQYMKLASLEKEVGKRIAESLGPIHRIIDDVVVELEKHIGDMSKGAYRTSLTNAENVTTIGTTKLKPEDIAKRSNKVKGLFGEVISDAYMVNERGYKSLMKPGRKPVHDLNAKAHGKGIDGVYFDKGPPPRHIVTEAKYRSSGKFNPDTELKKLKDDSTSMDDAWIGRRLAKEIGKEAAEKIDKYERWVLVVDKNGAITQIHRLDGDAKVIDQISPWSGS